MNDNNGPRLALTPGEPAGIGPDLVVLLAASGRLPPDIVIIADPALLSDRAGQLGLHIQLSEYHPNKAPLPGKIPVLPVTLRDKISPGAPRAANAAYVLETLDAACRGCLDGSFAGMVTGPLHKGIINDAGIRFSGHTEYLADRCNVEHTVMLLTDGNLRVALMTTHLPLRDVAAAIIAQQLEITIRILHQDLQRWFDLDAPRICVLGLNPHAGEGGHLGREEIDIIMPVIDALRREGLALSGPVPADTAFTPAARERYDAVLAMYHDQGLPVLKATGFGHTVNITLGLPIIRTSVDHGTALDIAGTGQADPGSLLCAVSTAMKMAGRRVGTAQ
ncbi:MAG: 4-hydroxythreonine-4-phosphate dehydrogenase PdxA [Gammaproteobacteria bacterium]|nr:4-hydroxythreonine-4-phosphate dehydrogenase PdxA [Gammaproteobacteria bacterium]